MPQKLVDMKETTTKEYPYKVVRKEEQLDMQITLRTLHSSYTFLKIPKDHAHIWLQGIFQLPLFSWDELIHYIWR